MKSYEIEVKLVNVDGKSKGQALQVSPERMEITLPNSTGIAEHAIVTWKFKQLPADLTPVIAFELPEVIASGPTTILGATPQVAFEIRFPPSVAKGPYSARYKISVASRSSRRLEPFPAPVDGPSLVVVRSPDPPTTTPPPPNNYPPALTASDADA
jgi:hypothetical protein